MARTPSCPKCQSAMVEGFILDNTHGGSRVGSWVEGQPEKSIFNNVKLRGRKPVEVVTWRCRSCGFLESYAAG